jgi:hypothetical protein
MLPRLSDFVPTYQPREAGRKNDPLYRVIQDNLEDFLGQAEERGRRIPAFVEGELRAYLKCGRAEYGFTWLKCEDCQHSLALPFSCKGRGFCASCGGRRMNQLAANLVDRVIPEVPVRHFVMSFPMNVRFLLAWRPQLRNEVMAAFFDIVLDLRSLGLAHCYQWVGLHRRYQKRVERQGHPAGQGGAVGIWHLAGSALNVNPHIHAILLDGSYVWDEERRCPVFQRARRPTRKVMGRLVREVRVRVLAILERSGLLEHVDLDEENGQLQLQHESVQGRGAQRGQSASTRPPRQRGGLWGWDEYYVRLSTTFQSLC